MSKIIFFVLCLSFLLGCGAGDYISEADCQALCQKNLECDPETNLAECEADCEQSKLLIRGAVFDAMAECILDLPCNSDQAEACLDGAMSKAPSGASDGLLRTMCQKQIDCAGGTVDMTVSACVSAAKAQAGEYLEYLNAFKSTVLSCLSSCVSKLSCTDLEDDNFMDPCMEQCGIPTGEDTSPAPGP
jgi:hypothetical protein